MSLMEAVKSVFRNYANFNGRARRSEYWKFFLFNILITVIGALLGTIVGAIADDPGVGLMVTWGLLGFYSLATIIPGLAVMCRRLHDGGKSGAYIFFALLPIVGEILLWVWAFQDGQPWTNQYGADPKGRNMTPFGTSYGTFVPVSDSTSKEPRKTKNCPHCGEAIDNDATFCSRCGKDTRVAPKIHLYDDVEKEPTRSTKTCVNCGVTVEPGTRFCPMCGKSPDKIEVMSQPNNKPKGFSAPTDLD